jgi:titin
VAGENAVTLTSDPFVNAARGNFYPAAKAEIIDAALDVLQDRPASVAVTQPLGLPVSPIIAPSRDLFGQLRSDDPGQETRPGLGSNVFKDLGAIDRVDFTQPWLTLADPLDQGSQDADPNPNVVTLSGAAANGLAKFIFQLNDAGAGIDKTTVVKQAFSLVRNGTTLTEGVDYVFRYLESTNRVVFESSSAYALGEYEILVTTRPATATQDGYLTDLANNVLLNNNTDGTTSFRVLLVDVPSAPTAVAATPGDGQASLSWTAPANAFGVTDYVIQYKTTAAATWSTFADGPSATLAATVTGLTNGTAYVFRVAAVNAAGTGDFSAESAPVTPSAPAPAPTNLTPTFGDGSVGLAWTAPGSDGGTPITDYVIEYRTDVIGSSWTTFADGVGTGLTATVTGLTNGTAYRFRVAAVNGVGTGTYSSEVTETPRAVPLAPTGLAGVAGNSQVVLSWTAAVANGSAVTDYVVEYKTTADATWSTFTDGVSTAISATVTGLTNGTDYLFRVSAVNSVGTGSASSQAGPYTPAMPASAPTGLTPTFGDGSVTLAWTAPVSNGGAAIVDYAVEYKTAAEATWSTFTDGVSTATSATVTGLTNGTAYLFRVAAVNSVGSGAYSNEVTETPRAVPSAPTGLAGVPGNAQVALTWTAPAANGAVITDYVVEYRTAVVGSSWMTFADGTSAGTSATVTGLTNGTAYLFRVKAVNSVGTGAASAEDGPLTPRTVPGMPTDLVGTPQNGQVALSWNQPTSDGGAAITDYVVQFKTTTAVTWTTFADGTSTATSATVTGLTNGTAYMFRVAAVNVAGTGTAIESASVTPRTVPGPVTNVRTAGANGRVNVSWTAPASNGGAPITDYLISVSTNPTSGFVDFGDGVSTATSATITGLTNGVTYYVRVGAQNAAGNSTTAQAGPVVPFIQAAAPTGLTGTVGSGRVNLAWTAGSSSKPITDYVIQFRKNVVGSAWTTFADGVSAATIGSVTGLVNGTRYLFRVAAVNADGVGVFTSGTLGLTPVAVPVAAPTAVTGRGAAGAITLNWVAAPSSTAAPVTGYVIQYRANTSTARWVTLPLAVGNATTARITTLTSRLGYRFRVAAQNAAGLGPWSAASALIRPF